MAIAPRRKKKCAICGDDFKPHNTLAKVCSVACSIKMVEINKQKKAGKERKEEYKRVKSKLRQLSLKDKPKSQRAAQAAFNAFIRHRDKGEPCISCQRHHTGQYHAGHYKSRGAYPELAFEEFNCHKQCAPCNNHLSGNIVNYRPTLIEKIGLEKVEWLEGSHEPKKYTADDFREIEREYKAKLKELKANDN